MYIIRNIIHLDKNDVGDTGMWLYIKDGMDVCMYVQYVCI